MNHPDNEDIQLYLSRVRPAYHQLFNIAHAVTGSAAQAEYCLQFALLDCWQGGENSHRGLRDALKRAVIRCALKNSGADAPDWDAMHTQDTDPDTTRRLIAQESIETRRILALKYGCGLSYGRIAKLTDIEAARVRQITDRFEARTRRKLEPSEHRKYDVLIQRAIRSYFAEAGALAPEMNSVFRSFQADAADIAKPSKLPMRIVKWFFAALLAIICIAAFWITAILIQQPVLEEPAQTEITETLE